MVFSGVVCVSCTGDEGFQPKDLEVLRSTRASVERHSCSDHTLLCPILLKQDLLSAVQILYASFSAFRFIPLSVEFKLWHSLSASALGRRSDCRWAKSPPASSAPVVEEEMRSSCHLVVKQSSDILQEQGIVPLTGSNWVSIRLEEGVIEEKESHRNPSSLKTQWSLGWACVTVPAARVTFCAVDAMKDSDIDQALEWRSNTGVLAGGGPVALSGHRTFSVH